MKYLREFENEAAYSAYTQSEDYVTPNVCYCDNERTVIFNRYVEPPLPLYVDLGLPSGLKWARCNVGATSPEEDGLYFSWGNTDGHAKDSGYNFDQTTYNSTPGAAISADLSLSQDAAAVNIGGSWRMPTKDEYQELYDNTDNEWVSDFEGTGVHGWKFMKKSDHNVFVFFPASGLYNGTTLKNHGTSGNYWSSSYKDSTNAYFLFLYSGSSTPQYYGSRRIGYCIRPVQ